MKIPITLDGVTGAVRALVVENLAVDLLLGREGLTQLGVVLDFGTQTYEVRWPGGARAPTETKQIDTVQNAKSRGRSDSDALRVANNRVGDASTDV